MALKTIVGLDHVVAVTCDLAAAAERWRALGFTLSPRGVHSAKLGTANHTIMFGADYIELLGVVSPTDYNAPSRAFLERQGEGIERAALTTADAAAGVAEIRALGFAGVGPVDFGRPVTLPGGSETQARFRVFLWPPEERPGGVRLFACQHVTPDAVFIPALQAHANTAQRIVRMEIASPDPRADAEHLARLIDGAAAEEGDGAFSVPSGGTRAPFVFLTREALARRYPGVSLAGFPERGAAALAIAVTDLGAAARAAGPSGMKVGEAVCVAPAEANGVLLCFVGETAGTA